MGKLRAIFFISFKNLASDKVRFAITVAGVSLAVALILVLRGIAYGTLLQATAFVDKATADLFVVHEEVDNLYQGFSILPKGTGEVIEDIDGVRKVNGVWFSKANFSFEGETKNYFFFFGLEPDSEEGRSWQIVEGRRWQNSSEIVVDRVLAKKLEIDLGSQIRIQDLGFRVVGFTVGGSTPLGSFAFVTPAAAARIFRFQNVVNHFQVFLDEGHSCEEMIEKIRAVVPDVEIYTHEQFRRNHQKVIQDSIIPPLEVMSMISFFVGLAVIGLTLYTNTIEKRREYGVIKAIGATNYDLYQIVFWQAVAAALIGFLVGVAIAFLIRWLVSFLAPEVGVAIALSLLIFVFSLANVMSFLAVFIPARVIARIDPAIAFKE